MFCAKSDTVKRARAAAVSLVSFQLNCPAPKMTRTIWARKTIKSTVIGTDQKIMWDEEVIISSVNFTLSPLPKSLARVGKVAIE